MSETMKPGPELDSLIATRVLGLERRTPDSPYWDVAGGSGRWRTVAGFRPSTDLTTSESAAEEARKAGKIDAWDVHQFETASASTGKLTSNGRTLAWADPSHGEQRAHSLALALLKAVGA